MSRQCKAMEKKYLQGRSIEPISLRRGMSVKDLIDVYAGMGFNARRLAESCEVFANMLKADATVCLTLAGAMTPIGMSGALITLMENGWVDWVISTGANLYHDLHRAFDFPMSQGHFQVDDNELKDAGIARIYDVFIQEGDTMIETDRTIIEAFINREFSQPVSTADVHAILGQEVNRRASHAEKSFVGRAAQLFLGYEPGESQLLVLGHAEVDTHRVECRYVREQAVRSRRNEAARLLARKARDTGERRTDRRVAQVDLGLLYPGACALDGSDGRIARALGVVEVLLAQCVLRRQRADTLQVGGCRREPRLLRLELGASCRERCLERLPVHLEEHGALLHDAAFVVGDRFEEALDARTDLDLLRALGFPDEFSDVWHVGRGHGHHDRGDSLLLRRWGRLVASASSEHDCAEDD